MKSQSRGKSNVSTQRKAVVFRKRKFARGTLREGNRFDAGVGSPESDWIESPKSLAAVKKDRIDFSQQAKRASIVTLSAGMSHEIKNVFQVIRGIVEMLEFNKKSGFYEEYTKEQYEALIEDALSRVLDAAQRATEIFENGSRFFKKTPRLKTKI